MYALGYKVITGATRLSTSTKLWSTLSSFNWTWTWMWSAIGRSSPDAVTSHCTAGTHSINLTCTALQHSLSDQWYEWSRVQYHLQCNTPIFLKILTFMDLKAATVIMLTSGIGLTVARGAAALDRCPLVVFLMTILCSVADHMWNSAHGMDSLTEGAWYAYSGSFVFSHAADRQECSGTLRTGSRASEAVLRQNLNQYLWWVRKLLGFV